MIRRTLWVDKIGSYWKQRNIVWLSGVRRIGKTTLAKQLPDAVTFNCDLPSVQRQLQDPELFFNQQPTDQLLVLDEVHRLADPSLVLKIAADAFGHLRILATGSSTLDATRKFRDSLTGRRRSLHLMPVLWRECRADFGIVDLDRRFLHGGFPEMLLAKTVDVGFFEEWIDSYYARDIQELFNVRNRTGFMALFRLLLLRSGGQLEISDLAKESHLNRMTVMAHLDALEIAHAMVRLPPYHGGGHREITKQPKVYAFDTGIVAHVKGWDRIRSEDRGLLWEHLVLDELRAKLPMRMIHYWRDKSQREIDFVIERKPNVVDTAEAKINPDAHSVKNLAAFRGLYPHGENYLVCPFVAKPYLISPGGHPITVCGVEHLNGDENDPSG